MSILTQLIEGKVSPLSALAQAIGWSVKVVEPVVAPAPVAPVAPVPVVAPPTAPTSPVVAAEVPAVVAAVTTALEAALSAVTKGLSTPFDPIITEGVNVLSTEAINAVSAWLKSKGL